MRAAAVPWHVREIDIATREAVENAAAATGTLVIAKARATLPVHDRHDCS